MLPLSHSLVKTPALVSTDFNPLPPDHSDEDGVWVREKGVLEYTLKSLREELIDVQEKLSELRTSLQNHLGPLYSECEALSNECRDLTLKLESLHRLKLYDCSKSYQHSFECGVDRAVGAEDDEILDSLFRDAEKYAKHVRGKQLPNSELKKLFRKIASKCHPDKHSTPEKKQAAQKLFIEARDAYNRRDLNTLQEIYRAVTDPSFRRSTVLSRLIDSLRADIATTRRILDASLESDDWRLYKSWRLNPYAFMASSREASRSAIASLKAQRDYLKAQLNVLSQ